MGIKDWLEKTFRKEDLRSKRQSVEPVSVYLPKTQDIRSRLINPRFPREALGQIEKAVFNNPILSQVHNLTINLTNTGHSVEVVPENKEALKELKNFASQQNVDALCNALFSQIILYGAVSCEIVVSEKLDGVQKIVRVHPQYVYFEYDQEADEWIPYQMVGTELIKLNPKTYLYLPILTIDSSPYAIPPMLASLQLMDTTDQLIQELKNLAQKMGLLGFLDIQFPSLPKAPSETETEYRERSLKFLEQMAKHVQENIHKGVLLHFEGTEVEFKDISTQLSGIKDLLSTLEKWTIESAKGQPALLGFSEGYTETWATVSLYVFASQLKNYQRLVERFLEYTYKLHLALKGYDVEDVNVSFADPPNFKAREEEEARKTRVEWVIQLLQAGIISLDEARNLLGDVL
jgi:hypothetical protein